MSEIYAPCLHSTFTDRLQYIEGWTVDGQPVPYGGESLLPFQKLTVRHKHGRSTDRPTDSFTVQPWISAHDRRTEFLRRLGFRTDYRDCTIEIPGARIDHAYRVQDRDGRHYLLNEPYEWSFGSGHHRAMAAAGFELVGAFPGVHFPGRTVARFYRLQDTPAGHATRRRVFPSQRGWL